MAKKKKSHSKKRLDHKHDARPFVLIDSREDIPITLFLITAKGFNASRLFIIG